MQNREIVFDIVACQLGQLLVAATERGVCHVRFGEEESELERDVHHEFGFAALRRDPVALKLWCDMLVAYIDGHSPRLELPLDVSGSRFQKRVWDALRRIPRGETRSYARVARELGVAAGARAVARACAANPVAVAIPCHRVIRSDGGLGGYHWGLERKRVLLVAEAEPPTGSNAGRHRSG